MLMDIDANANKFCSAYFRPERFVLILNLNVNDPMYICLGKMHFAEYIPAYFRQWLHFNKNSERNSKRIG